MKKSAAQKNRRRAKRGLKPKTGGIVRSGNGVGFKNFVRKEDEKPMRARSVIAGSADKPQRTFAPGK